MPTSQRYVMQGQRWHRANTLHFSILIVKSYLIGWRRHSWQFRAVSLVYLVRTILFRRIPHGLRATGTKNVTREGQVKSLTFPLATSLSAASYFKKFEDLMKPSKPMRTMNSASAYVQQVIRSLASQNSALFTGGLRSPWLLSIESIDGM